MYRSLSLLALSGLTLPALAQEPASYLCTNGSLERRIVVMYETGTLVPCEVHYFKDSEAPGESEVLWRALNETGYCEARAAEFATQLADWGWQCSGASTPATPATDDGLEAEPEVSDVLTDDTDALAPSDEADPSEPRR